MTARNFPLLCREWASGVDQYMQWPRIFHFLPIPLQISQWQLCCKCRIYHIVHKWMYFIFRPYVVNLLPCLSRICKRTEESVQETLSSAMHKICPVLIGFATDIEAKAGSIWLFNIWLLRHINIDPKSRSNNFFSMELYFIWLLESLLCGNENLTDFAKVFPLPTCCNFFRVMQLFQG